MMMIKCTLKNIFPLPFSLFLSVVVCFGSIFFLFQTGSVVVVVGGGVAADCSSLVGNYLWIGRWRVLNFKTMLLFEGRNNNRPQKVDYRK